MIKGMAIAVLPAAAIILCLTMMCTPAFSHHAFSAEFDVKTDHADGHRDEG